MSMQSPKAFRITLNFKKENCMSNLKTKVQEVYFDLCDAIDEGNLYDVRIDGFDEFKTVLEFLQEQKTKLAQIESMLEEETV
jgi:uncharacterized UPF0160 family protein